MVGLDRIVSQVLANVDFNVRIEGHASSEGQTEHNQKLSENRAHAVMRYLVRHGVDEKRLSAVGFGSTVPVSDNDTVEGREANRRVEFTVNFVLVKGN